MPADTFDPILGLIEMGTGNNNNSWGNTFNGSFGVPTAQAISGLVVRGNTGSTLDLSASPPPAGLRQDIHAIQYFNGALTSDLTVIVPNLSKTWWFQNNTSGNFNLFVKTTAGTATQIPQGVGRMVMGDGNNVLTRSDKDSIGSFRLSGKAAAGPGELPCNGASLLKAEFPDLFSAIGTIWGSVDSVHFTLPNFTDTGRFLRSSSGTLSVGTYQSNQNLAHTHTITGAPSVGTLTTDSQGAHTHSATPSDPTHTHTLNNANRITDALGTSGGLGGGGNFGTATGIFSNAAAATGISVTIGSAGAHTHNVTGSLTAGTLANGSSGGTEARPESAVVLTCILY